MTVKIKVLGIPVEVDYNIEPADPSVGISHPYLEDIEFFNVKNGSHLRWLEEKVEAADKWQEVHDAIWDAINERSCNDY